jgi:hypothetical protein
MRGGSLAVGIVMLIFGGILFFVGLNQYEYGQTIAGEISSGFNTNMAVQGAGLLLFGGLIGLIGLILLGYGFGGSKSPIAYTPQPVTPLQQSTGGVTKFCTKCGNRIAQAAGFCSSCGNPQSLG